MKFSANEIHDMANSARAWAMFAVRNGASGHVGLPLGCADIVTSIYANHSRFDPKNPGWAERDRFVLSAGHGSALLYSVLKLSGYDIPDLSGFRKFGSKLGGHPEYGDLPGVECTTGPLGQGVASAVGMAIAAKKNAPESRVYVLCSDGDLMEGVAGEAAALAGYYKLNNLILFWDDNGISIDGDAINARDIPLMMRAAGFEVLKVDGTRPREINAAIERAKKSRYKPVFIQCKTVIGYASSLAGTAAAHALNLNADQLLELENKFQNVAGENLWAKLAAEKSGTSGGERLSGAPIKPDLSKAFEKLYADKSLLRDMATRAAGGLVLERIAALIPNLIGGNADLAESTKMRATVMRDITPGDFSGNYINYGVREHAMAAIMNGLALSEMRPIGGTFLAFSDYMRPAIRLSAIMKLPVVYVFTHDSIAVGPDGPTHQPVEQLSSLRMIPGMRVYRPADVTETIACFQMAFDDATHPSAMILSRQKLPALSKTSVDGVRRGGYIVKGAERKAKSADITLIATGSEVSLALNVAEIIESKSKIGVSVVSIPSVEVFKLQSESYRNKILTGRVVAIEAGVTGTWFEFADAVVGIDTFGANGPGDAVYKHFGFDAPKIADEILKKM